MTDDANKALTPKLRFPDFQEQPSWEYRPLAKLGDIITGKTPNTKDLDLWGGDILFITPTDISADGKYQHTTARKVVESGSTRVLPAGSIVYTCIASIGKMALTVRASITNQQINSVVVNPSVDGEYVYYALSNLTPWIQSIPATSTLPIINKSEFSKILVAVPSAVVEQQKIAECLSTLDELIVATSQKLDALKAHKKGLMQQLFPREGETVPRLRFPEFHEAPEWEERRVGELGDVLAGKALAVNALGPQRPYLRTKNVLDGAIDLSDVRTMPMTDAEFSRFEIFNGDVLLNEGQSLELVGRASIYRGEFGGRCAIQNQLLRFRAFPSTSPEFAAQVFRQCQQDGTFTEIATKTTSIAHLGSSRFSALALPWPSPAEQHRIATCLSSLDELIAAQSDKLGSLKAHKKGLMQQLFPSPAEAVE